MNTSFIGKVALVTGGTSGIGRATAIAFAERGADVVVAGRRDAEGAETVTLIQKAGGQGLFVRTDVTNESEIASLVARTREHFGRLDFASVLGLRPRAGSPIYSASKAAVIALGKSVALEFAAQGIRVNAVCAAVIETDMTKKIRNDEETRRSPEAAFITGAALPIDGGFAL